MRLDSGLSLQQEVNFKLEWQIDWDHARLLQIKLLES